MPKHRAAVLAIRSGGEHSYAHEGTHCILFSPLSLLIQTADYLALEDSISMAYQTEAIVEGRRAMAK